jgi:xylose isomerase
MPDRLSAMPGISTHLGYFGTGADRYNSDGYRPATNAVERIRLASRAAGLGAVELHYPMMFKSVPLEDIKACLSETHLACSIVSVSLWDEARWGMGSFTHPDPAMRREAAETVRQGMAVAKALGADKINLWLGQDGFDYPFQIDYRAANDWLIHGLREAASAEPGVRICLEYKPKEPRAHLAVNSVGKVLWLADKVGLPNVGCLLDVGHAFLAYESPAESAALLQAENRLFHIHFNDNYGEWDWDMMPGTIRFWENLEFVFWLQHIGYQDWLSIDITMPRGDPCTACQQSVDTIRGLWNLAAQLDPSLIHRNFAATTHPDNLRWIMDMIFARLGC